MKKTFLAAGLVVVFGSGLVGCKTTPKLAFWKKDAAADAAAIAHTAPTLPSDLAKQGLAGATNVPGTTSVAQSRMTEAAPFVPGQVARTASPASYPSTDAPPFTPDVASQIARTSQAAAPTSPVAQTPMAPSSHLGSIAAAPYNPSTPPAPTASQTAATSPIPESRYGGASASSAPVYGQPPIGALAGGSNATSPAPAPSNGLADAPAHTTPTAPAGSDRYGSGLASTTPAAPASRYGGVLGASATTPVTTGASASPQTATTAVATTAQPYRPGGTASYTSGGALTGSQPTARMAAVPQDSLPAPITGSSTPPNVARPGSDGVTTPTTTPSATSPGRYW